MQHAVGRHDVASDDLLAVDVQLTFQIALQEQRRAEQGRRTGPSLDHRRTDDVGNQMLFDN